MNSKCSVTEININTQTDGWKSFDNVAPVLCVESETHTQNVASFKQFSAYSFYFLHVRSQEKQDRRCANIKYYYYYLHNLCLRTTIQYTSTIYFYSILLNILHINEVLVSIYPIAYMYNFILYWCYMMQDLRPFFCLLPIDVLAEHANY